MLFAPEIRYQSLTTEQLQRFAGDLQKALPASSITLLNKKARPTDWENQDVVAFRVYDAAQKKPFFAAGLKGALVVPKHTTDAGLDRALGIVSELETEEDSELNLGVFCTICFLAIIAFIFAEKTTPHNLTLAAVFLLALILFFVGLVMLAIRSTKAPRLGRSGYAIALILPSLVMMSPLSVLNLPLLNSFKREQGRRLLLTILGHAI